VGSGDGSLYGIGCPVGTVDDMCSQRMLEGEPRLVPLRARVLAGFDGSPGSIAAIEWASQEAAVREVPLRVMTCAAVPDTVDLHDVGTCQIKGLSQVLTRLRGRYPNLIVDCASTRLDPRRALIDEAASVDLLVIGATEERGPNSHLRGSVTRTAARRGPCPVVVVRGCRLGPVRRIVVGVDGSSAALAALDLACYEAHVHGAQLSVIHAWEGDVTRVEARCMLALAMNECRDRFGGVVDGVLAEGSPSRALSEASRDADLVVVGSRGRSGFKTALFGSVALSLAEDAHCPVVVTHPTLRSN
jgi:nucleotide-binding universal stress UspA family protein